MKYFLLYIVFFLYLTCLLNAQFENVNWYFGKFAGITFNTGNGEPIFLKGNPLQQTEGVSTISSKDGKLLLHTNGIYVTNSQSLIINNDNNPLKGHESSTQSALIVPKPDNDSLYYIFTSDAGEYLDPPNQGIHYSVINIKSNNEFGKIELLNKQIISKASEKLTFIKHFNNRDIWIIAKGYGNNRLYSFLLTKDSLFTTPKITELGFSPSKNFESIGTIKISRKGIAALVYEEAEIMELMQFDRQTGVFSNLIQFTLQGYNALYGIEFSHNNNFLYVSNVRTLENNSQVFQFDISNYDSAAIINSKQIIINTSNTLGALQIGPNRKIYIAQNQKNFISSIPFPDKKYPDCQWIDKSIFMQDSSQSLLGLPQFLNEYNFNRNIYLCEGDIFQLDPDFLLEDTVKYKYNYKWSGPNSFNAKTPLPIIDSITLLDEGQYILEVNYYSGGDSVKYILTLNLSVNPRPIASIIGDSIMCDNNNILRVGNTDKSYKYLWSDNSTADSIFVTKSGIYKLIVTNSYGCQDSTELKVIVNTKPIAEITGINILCGNSPIRLTSKYIADTLHYLWSNGSTAPSILVSQAGIYKLKVINSYGCIDSSEIEVMKLSDVEIELSGNKLICGDNPTIITVKLKPNLPILYDYITWSDGTKNDTLITNKQGFYTLELKLNNDCIFSESISIIKANIPTVEINARDTIQICNDKAVFLKLKNPSPELTYQWNTGSKDTVLRIDTFGLYIVKVSNIDGCYSFDSVYIIPSQRPNFSIKTKNFLNDCLADSALLIVEPFDPNYYYKWSNSVYGDSIMIRQSGIYKVIVENDFGCRIELEQEVIIGSGPTVNILGNTYACQGDSILLTSEISNTNKDSISYLWSNGDTNNYIYVKNTGNYTLDIIDKDGCKATANYYVTFYQKPTVELNYKGNIELCDGDEIELEVINYDTTYNYYWSDGYNQRKRTINKAGNYKIYVSNSNACIDSTDINITFYKLQEIVIHSNKSTTICDGDSLILWFDPIKNYTYKWFSGSIDTSIVVYSAGIYKLYYANEIGCKDSISVKVKRGLSKDFDIIANKIEICNGDSAKLEVNENFNKYIWSTGETTKSIYVNKSGNYSVVVYDENNCSNTKEITIFEKIPKFEIDIVSDTLYENCTDSLTATITIINRSNNLQYISNINFDNNLFDILNINDIIGEIKPLETKDIIFNIKKSNLGKNSYNFEIIVEKPCRISKEFELIYQNNIENKIYFDTLKVLEVEKEDCIDVYFEKLCGTIISDSLELTIRIAAEYFKPETITIGKIKEIVLNNGYWKIRLTISNLVLNNNDIINFKICGKNLLGSSTPSKILVDKINWTNPNIKTTVGEGYISSILCAIDLRGIKLFEPTTMNISPNPLIDNMEINVSTQSIGKHKIKIYNSSGQKFYENEFEQKENIHLNHKFSLNLYNWNQGFYVIYLESPWGVINYQKIIIIK